MLRSKITPFAASLNHFIKFGSIIGRHPRPSSFNVQTEAVAEAGGGWQGPGPCKEIFLSLSLYKIIKILIFLKYFF
jgi:hypothetical protein